MKKPFVLIARNAGNQCSNGHTSFRAAHLYRYKHFANVPALSDLYRSCGGLTIMTRDSYAAHLRWARRGARAYGYVRGDVVRYVIDNYRITGAFLTLGLTGIQS